jgi:hypothetical protein
MATFKLRFMRTCLIRVTVKTFYLPHCLSKLLGFSKRVEAVRVASFFNPSGIVVLVKDAKVFAITSYGYAPPELLVVLALAARRPLPFISPRSTMMAAAPC